MKTVVLTNPPEGFEATPEIKIFSPIDNPETCVMAQRFTQSRMVINAMDCWVAIPTERVNKLEILETPKIRNHEQV